MPHEKWWWPSWAIGVLLAFVAFFVLVSPLGGVIDDPSFGANDFLVLFAYPVALCMAVPGFWFFVGFVSAIWMVARGARAVTKGECILPAPVAFMSSVVVAAACMAALVSSAEDVMAGMAIHFLTGQISVGIYLPFSIAVACCWWCGRTQSIWLSVVLLVVAALCTLGGSSLGFVLGKYGA